LGSFSFGNEFAEGNAQRAGNGFGRVQIGTAFPALQQADVSLVQARLFRQRGANKTDMSVLEKFSIPPTISAEELPQ
jgi:hypothetical protein